MSYSLEQQGVLEAVLDRFKNQRLPRILAIKKLVDEGKVLNQFDIAFLSEVFSDTQQYQHFVDQHEEFQQLYARIAHLYEEIAKTALKNETSSGQ